MAPNQRGGHYPFTSQEGKKPKRKRTENNEKHSAKAIRRGSTKAPVGSKQRGRGRDVPRVHGAGASPTERGRGAPSRPPRAALCARPLLPEGRPRELLLSEAGEGTIPPLCLIVAPPWQVAVPGEPSSPLLPSPPRAGGPEGKHCPSSSSSASSQVAAAISTRPFLPPRCLPLLRSTCSAPTGRAEAERYPPTPTGRPPAPGVGAPPPLPPARQPCGRGPDVASFQHGEGRLLLQPLPRSLPPLLMEAGAGRGRRGD